MHYYYTQYIYMAHTEKDDNYGMEGTKDSAGNEHLKDFLKKRKVKEPWRQKNSRR